MEPRIPHETPRPSLVSRGPAIEPSPLMLLIKCGHAGGGGPKAELLQKMIAEEGLESRVHMVGPVPHEKARDLLVSTSCMPACFWLHNLALTMKPSNIGLFCLFVTVVTFCPYSEATESHALLKATPSPPAPPPPPWKVSAVLTSDLRDLRGTLSGDADSADLKSVCMLQIC